MPGPPQTPLVTLEFTDGVRMNAPALGPDHTLVQNTSTNITNGRINSTTGSGGWNDYSRAFDRVFWDTRANSELRLPMTGQQAGPFSWAFPGGEQNSDFIYDAKFVLNPDVPKEKFGSLGIYRYGRIGFRYQLGTDVYFGPPTNLNNTTTRIQVGQRFATGVYIQLLEGVSGSLYLYDYPPCPLPQIDVGFGDFQDYNRFPFDYPVISV